MKDKEQQRLDKAWNNFEKTGRIMDYMDYLYLKRDILGEYMDLDR